MMRRVALTVAALMGATALPSTPVAAAGHCTISVPTKLTIKQPYTEYTSTFYGSCTTGDGWGSWQLVHPTQGPQNFFLVQGSDPLLGKKQTENFYDWEPRGTLKVVPEGAHDSSYADLTQNSRTMTVKLGSSNALSASRSGSTVRLTSTVKYYSPNRSAFLARSGATVKFYARTTSGSWIYKGSATSNSRGQATVSVRSGAAAKPWKAVMMDQSSVWGSTSNVTSR